VTYYDHRIHRAAYSRTVVMRTPRLTSLEMLLKNIAGILAILIFCTPFSGCSYFRPLDGKSPVQADFLVYKDSRVLFKPGMEAQAKLISSFLDSAVKQVELAHGKPFTKDVVVHLCDTTKCFSHYTNSSEIIKGAVSINGLFLSPLCFENNREKLFLTHELSHLHLFQQISIYQAIHIPQWFHDGLAVYASNGGGADLVNEKNAILYLKENKHIEPIDTGGLLGKGGAWGERWPTNYPHVKDSAFQQQMNYRQSEMFYVFLNKKNRATQLLRKLEEGEDFKESFKNIFGKTTHEIWHAYIGEQTLTSQSTRNSVSSAGA
jgi:hypothetical protein